MKFIFRRLFARVFGSSEITPSRNVAECRQQTTEYEQVHALGSILIPGSWPALSPQESSLAAQSTRGIVTPNGLSDVAKGKEDQSEHGNAPEYTDKVSLGPNLYGRVHGQTRTPYSQPGDRPLPNVAENDWNSGHSRVEQSLSDAQLQISEVKFPRCYCNSCSNSC